MHSTFTIFNNGSIILPGFKFTELHTLTLAARSYALLTGGILDVYLRYIGGIVEYTGGILEV